MGVGSINFNNTQIAFSSRSTGELRRAQLLFRSFNLAPVVSVGPKLASLALRLRLPVTPLIRLTMFDHFCGGETIDDCASTVAALGRYKIKSILDYSVEALGSEADFAAATEETLRVIAKAKTDAWLSFAVFKVTGIARVNLLEKVSSGETLSPREQAEFARVEERFRRLCRAAHDAGRRLLIDAEESWLQPAIDALALAAMREFNAKAVVVYNTLQMYRVGRLDYLHELHRLGQAEGFVPGIKLVRGAYMEKERARAAAKRQASPIQPDKAATDRDFDAALAFCIEHLGALALFSGTHNEESTRRLTELMAGRGLSPSDPRVDFSQLLGMSDHLTYNLAHHGYNVSKYVPYGPVKAVLPYLARRAEENSSIKGQAGRELQLIEKELQRRAHQEASPQART